MQEKLLTIRDVAILLGISEKEVMDLAESGTIPAYKIGGVYLRFRREQVEAFRKKKAGTLSAPRAPAPYPLNERVSDFFYFNDYYILVTLIVIILLVIIFHGK
jgi:excisionase family DNA binding protein